MWPLLLLNWHLLKAVSNWYDTGEHKPLVRDPAVTAPLGRMEGDVCCSHGLASVTPIPALLSAEALLLHLHDQGPHN